jgi:hypothetical protein
MYLTAFILLGSAVSFASTTGEVYISGVDVRNDGTFIVSVNGTVTGGPACATVNNALSGDSSTAGGKSLLQVAMSAFLSGKQVNLEGTGHCTQFSQVESLSRLLVH